MAVSTVSWRIPAGGWGGGAAPEGVKAVAMGLPLAEEGVAAAFELPKHALLKPQIPIPSDLFQVRAASW